MTSEDAEEMRATFVEATEHDFYSRFTNTGVAELALLWSLGWLFVRLVAESRA